MTRKHLGNTPFRCDPIPPLPDKGRELKSRNPEKTITIRPTEGSQKTVRVGDTIYLNPRDRLGLDPDSRKAYELHWPEKPPENDKGRAVIIGHEVGHIVTPGVRGRDEDKPGGRNVHDNENPIRSQLGLRVRTHYGGGSHPVILD